MYSKDTKHRNKKVKALEKSVKKDQADYIYGKMASDKPHWSVRERFYRPAYGTCRKEGETENVKGGDEEKVEGRE